jgi:hypothetical protein
VAPPSLTLAIAVAMAARGLASAVRGAPTATGLALGM